MHRKLWLLFVLLLLSVQGCSAETDDTTDDEEDVGETVDPLTVGPTWKMATLIFTHLDTDYVSGGVKHHAKTAMSAAMIDDVKGYADQAKTQWTAWNNGRANATMDKVVVPDAIRTLSVTDNDGHYWVAPENVAAQLDKYAPPGKYDSIFVVWNPASASPDIPICCAYGIGPQASTNGATYAAVPTAFKGGEAYVHEWLHGAGRFYRSHGFDVPDPHENRTFGYTSGAPTTGSWSAWYKALMRGALLRGGHVVGYQSSVWRSGTPRKWVGGSYAAQAKPTLTAPPLRTAEVQGDWVYLEWGPVKKTSHYTAILTVRKPDGSHGAWVTKYEEPGIDRGNFDYLYFPKVSICDAARRSGVPLGSVSVGFQLWPDNQVAHASNMNVSGTLDCR